MIDTDEPDVFVLSVTFGEGVIGLQYAERRKQAHVGGVVENITFDIDYIEDDVAELQQSAVDLVDVCLRLIRTPPKKKKPGKDMLRQVAEMLEEESDEDE